MALDEFSGALQQRFFGEDYFDARDFFEWRFCYSGGRLFRQEFLQYFNDREDVKEFARRCSLTPIPSYAKKEINKVKNSVARRLTDIRRSGGTKVWKDAVAGIGRGVDRRGSSMNSFIAKKLLADLLVQSRVGVLIDAPVVPDGATQADTVNYRPWLSRYQVEFIHNLTLASPESPSDWSSVKLEDQTRTIDPTTGEVSVVTGFRKYWLDEDRESPEGHKLVNVQEYDESDKPKGPIRFTNLDAIPFVLYSIEQSLMSDAWSYQVALLNMISADSSYAIDSNYSFLTRQRGGDDAGEWLIGEESEAETGRNKGLFYPKGMERPGYISPDPGPGRLSLEMRRELKKEIQELVLGALEEIGEGSIEAGLAFIGLSLATGEDRTWDHWVALESRVASQRRKPIIDYPDSWSMLSDEQRLEQGEKFLKMANLIVGQPGKKQAHLDANDRFWRGKVSTKRLEEIQKAVEDAPYAIADPAVIIPARKEGIFSVNTSALALGGNEAEGDAAKKDAAEKAAMVAASMADASRGTAKGTPELSAGQDSNKQSRAAEVELSKARGNTGTRGKGA